MILFIGVVGAGKSVQGRHLADLLGFPWVSTGELLRMHARGDKRERMSRGELLTDEELYEVVEPLLKELVSESQIVLDGFPRTTAQAAWLDEFMKQNGTSITCVVHLDVAKEEVLSRLLKRGRHDDTREVIEKRFDEYRNKTVPVLDHFRQQGVPVLDIDGNNTQEVVRKRIADAVKGLGIHR